MQLSEEQKTAIKELEIKGIFVKIDENNIVKIYQKEIPENIVYTNSDLHKIARQIFSTEYINPIVYALDLKPITVEFILDKMKQLNISKTSIVAQTGIKREDLLNVLTQKRYLTQVEKALFYYYFKYNEITK